MVPKAHTVVAHTVVHTVAGTGHGGQLWLLLGGLCAQGGDGDDVYSLTVLGNGA
jgi:hypothetical protein